MPLQPINRATTSQTITEYFAEKIRNGELRPGDRLPSERQLMAQLSVARSTIREAMQSLSSRNLIEIRVGEGTFVKGYGVGEVLQEKFKILLSEETQIDDLLYARRLIGSLIAKLSEVTGSMDNRSQAREAVELSVLSEDSVEISPNLLSSQHNNTLNVLYDILNVVISHRPDSV